MWFVELLIAVLLTAVFYTCPILIYRFCIRKKPLEKKPALVTVIVCAFILYLFMWILAYSITNTGANSTACIFWSIPNFFILTKGSDSSESVESDKKIIDTIDTIAPVKKMTVVDKKAIVSEQICFCRKCGNKLVVNSNFCNNCGSKIDWN
jgi:amino acid transporter